MAAAAPRTHQQQDQGWLHRAAVLWTGGVQAPGVVLVHFNIVIYAMAFWLTNPMLPFLLREHGASNLSFGMFQSLFALVQMGGGLTVGLLQDRTSSATALSVTQMGSSVVYLILLCAGSLEMLYLSRLPTVLQQAMQVAQAYLSKVTPDTNRAVAFSRVSVSYTIGMALGSTASGFIAEAFGTRSVMGLSFALSVAMVIINRLFLPDTPALPLQRSADDKVKPSTPSSTTTSNAATADTKITGYWSMVCALPKLFLFFAMVFVTRSLYEPVFTLQLLDKYSVGQSQMGYLMSIASAIGLAANVLLLPLLLKWTNESRVQAGAILVGCTMYGVIALVPLSLNGFMGVALVMAGAAALLYTTAASYLTAKVPTGIHGQAIASTHALRSAVGIVGPLAGTALLEGWGPGAVAGVNAVLLGSSLFFM